MFDFKTSCPDVSNMSTEELLVHVSDGTDGSVIKKENRVKIIEILYESLNFKLEPDLLLFLADESEKQLCNAPAGGGKTTTMNVKIILEKIYRRSRLHKGMIKGANVLCLVYNSSNVASVRDRHVELVNQFKFSGVFGVDNIDTDLNVSTVHSFCNDWVEEYAALCGVVGFTLVTADAPKVALMQTAVSKQIAKMGYNFSVEDLNINTLLSLYNYMRESMLSYEQLAEVDKFIDLDLDIDFIRSVFNTYDVVKKIKKKLDYTDLLTKFYELIKNNPEVGTRIRRVYEYFTADEVQDLTPIIIKILKLLVADHNLICIGDDDQCIYPFRGADPRNILEFPMIFPNSKVFLLKANRRCPSNVVDLASSVIGLNKYRFPKEIKSVKPKGKIEFIGYRDRVGQFTSVINSIKDMSDEERDSTCICYRNKSSSLSIVNMLIDSNIHHHILSGIKPFEYGLYRACFDVLRALQTCFNKKLNFNLYKALPVTKDEIAKVLNYNPVTGASTDDNEIQHFNSVDFGRKMKNPTFAKLFKFLVTISKVMNTVPLKDYFPHLLAQIKKYYWDGVVSYLQMDRQEDLEFTQSIISYFNVNKTFKELQIEHSVTTRVIERDQASRKGVCVSTFHSLKGLEYDNVFILDMQESIFPNTTFIDMKPYDEETKLLQKETETRLFYVAITRVRKNLKIYHSQSDPSIYISILKKEIESSNSLTPINRLTKSVESSSVVDDSESIVLIEENDEPLVIEDFQKVSSEATPEPISYKQVLRNRFFS